MKNNFNTYGIILAGGMGSRMNSDLPKQFLKLEDKPLILWSMLTFQNTESINNIIIVSSDEYHDMLGTLANDYKIDKLFTFAPAGKTRQESSYNAILSHSFNNNDILLFHDAARPFVTHSILNTMIETVATTGAASVYVKAIDTIAVIKNNIVESIPKRDNLYYTQTPQGFTYQIIKQSHDQLENYDDVTDDVSIVLKAGHEVAKVEGDYKNIKITTPQDYKIAQYLAKKFI